MEIMIHSFHVVAIKDSKAWMGFSLTQLYTMGYLNLYLVWLKLMIIWRFFRLWALTDNIETVENMTRCISANYSAMDFWKAWHVSYNRWLIRYVYVPLGGKKYYAYNIFPIFLWVGVWHGVEPHLLAWGLLIAALILPEFFCTRYFCQPKVRDYYGDWHLHICAAGGVINLLFMISTNLIGFVLGIDGFLRAFDRISIDQGLLFFVMIFLQLFCFVHCTFWEYAKQAEGKEIVSAKRDKRTLTGSSIFLQREE
jgi:D-alanyl-lipoteichoic acid acyltransferase DltB (MBOAT superfamily)